MKGILGCGADRSAVDRRTQFSLMEMRQPTSVALPLMLSVCVTSTTLPLTQTIRLTNALGICQFNNNGEGQVIRI